ncbi:helix-turn-helix domain-containing protein [Embleya sp. NBC_00896]|uniref:helix-turn-helix domain-containing protein n=1 Tax=Embleya sp. NBC_00896 TaxID=2975961 RepID=UPI002F910344|nr:helix-turn-helix domain-containing protein [Embleya sp. NBC_00896]
MCIRCGAGCEVCAGWRADDERAKGPGAGAIGGWRAVRAGEKTAEIAAELRVGKRQVEKWRRAWREGGLDALRSKGPMSVERLTPQQWEHLKRALGRGPLAHGWDKARRAADRRHASVTCFTTQTLKQPGSLLWMKRRQIAWGRSPRSTALV